jgi:hypothetical protein
MAVTITDLAYTENYDDLAVLSEAQLDAAFESIQTHINTYVANNLCQLAKDCYGNTDYQFDNDAAAQYTANLFDKQYGTDYYNGGNVSITTAATLAWAAVDAVNCSLSFTPEKAGKYRVVCYFTHRVASTATTEFSVDVGFRLTDGTDASYAVNSGGLLPATAAGSGTFIHPVFITHVFNWTTTTAKTITLQYYNRTCTEVNSNYVCAAAASGEFVIIAEKV